MYNPPANPIYTVHHPICTVHLPTRFVQSTCQPSMYSDLYNPPFNPIYSPLPTQYVQSGCRTKPLYHTVHLPGTHLLTLSIHTSGGSRNVRKGGRRCDPTFSRWGFGGRCKPPNGVRGGAPEANAFWQQSIENWLKIRSLGRPRVLNILYCSWDRAHAHATTSRLPPDRENPKAALFCLANRCSRSKMTER